MKHSTNKLTRCSSQCWFRFFTIEYNGCIFYEVLCDFVDFTLATIKTLNNRVHNNPLTLYFRLLCLEMLCVCVCVSAVEFSARKYRRTFVGFHCRCLSSNINKSYTFLIPIQNISPMNFKCNVISRKTMILIHNGRKAHLLNPNTSRCCVWCNTFWNRMYCIWASHDFEIGVATSPTVHPFDGFSFKTDIQIDNWNAQTEFSARDTFQWFLVSANRMWTQSI